MENWLTKRVHLTPEKTALVFKQKKWSFAELQVEVNQRAKRLLTLSYPEGSRIGVLGSNSPELYFTILALQQMGHTIVFLNLLMLLLLEYYIKLLLLGKLNSFLFIYKNVAIVFNR